MKLWHLDLKNNNISKIDILKYLYLVNIRLVLIKIIIFSLY